MYLRRHVTSLLAKIALIPFAATVVLLMLSDRAPAVTMAGLQKGLVVGRKFEGRTGIDLVDHSDVPFSWEQVGHAGLWAVATLLACTLVAHRASVFRIASGVFAASALFELGQVFFTTTRQLEWADLAANGVGIVLGASLGFVATLIGGRRRHHGVPTRSIAG